MPTVLLDDLFKNGNLTLSGGNLVATGNVNSWSNVGADTSRATGKFCFEVTTGQNFSGGVAQVTAGIGSALPGAGAVGETGDTWGVGNDGAFIPGPIFDADIAFAVAGDTIMICVDLDAGVFSAVSTSAGLLKVGFIGATFDTGNYFPMIGVYGVGAFATLNFGATPFANPIPALYSSWDTTQTSNVVTLDPTYKAASLTLSNGNLTETSTSTGWFNARATAGRSAGKFAFEVTNNLDTNTGSMAAIGPITQTINNYCGSAAGEVSIRTDGNVYTAGVLQTSTGLDWKSTGAAPTIMMLVDLDAQELYAIHNGGAPVLLYSGFSAGDWWPGVSVNNSPQSNTVNFGATPFVNTLPDDYSSWDGNQLAVDPYFSSVVAHWPLNGSLLAAVGSIDLVNSGGTPVFDGYDPHYYPESVHVPGTDSISAPVSPRFNFSGNRDFTIECWQWLDSQPVASGVFDFRLDNTAGSRGPVLYSDTSAGGRLRIWDGSNIWGSTGTGLPLNQWNHIAWVRNGGTTAIYLNGVAQWSQVGGVAYPDLDCPLALGHGIADPGASYADGRYSDIRISNEVRYSGASFSVPATTFPLEGPKDPYFGSVVSLIGFENRAVADSYFDNIFSLASFQTDLTSEIGPDLTIIGDVFIETDGGPFAGTDAAVLDGTGDAMSLAHSDNIKADHDLTIEAHVRFGTIKSGLNGVFCKRQGGGTGLSSDYNLWIDQANANRARLLIYNTSGLALLDFYGTSSLVINQWYHLAITYKASTGEWAIFVDGIKEATALESSGSGTPRYFAGPLYIGRDVSNLSRDLAGKVMDFRVTEAVRYTESFTVPTEAFPVGKYGTSDYTDDVNAVDWVATGTPLVTSGAAIYGTKGWTADALTENLRNTNISPITGDFTIELSVKAAPGTGQGLVDTRPIGDFTNVNSFSVFTDASGLVNLYSGGSVRIGPGIDVQDNNPHHIAIVRSSGVVTIYVDGVQSGGTWAFGATLALPDGLYIGGNGSATTEGFIGGIDEVRITDGVGRYPTAFSPPTLAFPREGSVTLDPLIKYAPIALSSGNLTAKSSNNNWGSTYGTRPRSSGKFAFEVTNIVSGDHQVGVDMTPSAAVSNYAGSAADSWGMSINGDFFNNASSVNLPLAAHNAVGAALMVAVDIDAGDFFVISSLHSTVVSCATAAAFAGQVITPQLSLYGPGNTDRINFGAEAFVNELPAGYTSWDGFQSALASTPVTGTLDIVWDVEESATAVAGTLELVWDVQETSAVQGTLDLVWGVSGVITGTVDFVWGVGGPVDGTLDIVWDTAAAIAGVSGTFELRWDVLVENNICRAFRVINDDEGFWKGFSDKSAIFTRGPLVNDAYDRYYLVQDSDVPRYTTYSVLELERRRRAQLVNNSYYRLGVPQPTGNLTVTSSGGTEDLTIDRSYTYTFISAFGEEGPPAETYTAAGADDGTWTLTGFDLNPEYADEREITGIRIYRTVTSSLGTAAFHFVSDIPISQATYVDNNDTSVVGSAFTIESTNYFPPPEGLKGLVAHPNGFFIGFVGRDIWMSEPYRPHAWPPGYVRSTLGDIVGFGVFGTSVVVGTESFPHILSGVTPDSMSLTQHDTAEPCLSRYGIVSMPSGVYYPGPNGLMLANSRGFNTITESLITREEWQSRYDPANIDAAKYQNSYVAFFSDEEGFIFTPTDPLYTFVELNQFWTNCGIQTDEYSGKVLMCNANELYEWNPPTGANATYVWESKEFDVPEPKNFGAFRVIYYGDPIPTDAQIQTWRDYNALRILDPLGPVNWNAVGASKKGYVADITNATPEWRQPVAGPVLNPVPELGQPWPTKDNLTVEFFANDTLVHTKVITTDTMLRLPSGFKATRWKIRLTGEVKVKTLKMAETGKELRSV